MAWANEIPPEVLRLSFSSNYSASQAAINQYKIFIERERKSFGVDFCQPIYVDWLISENLNGKVQNSAFMNAWRSADQYDQFAAWVASDWSGAVMLSSDILKQSRGYGEMVDRGWITNARATSQLSGMKFSRVIKQQKKENQQLVEARQPLRDAEAEQGQQRNFGEGGEQMTRLATAIADELEARSDD
jgi:hypothetical protein